MKYRELKTEPQYLKKLFADIVNRLGDSLDAITFTWMVYALTGSAALTATALAVNTLVTVILSPFSAALITNRAKKPILVICDIGRGAFVAAAALLLYTGALRPWMVIAITGLNSTLESFRLPAGAAVFPQIVPKGKYTLAVSLSGAASRAAELIGTGAAGIIVGALGIPFALAIDGAMFLLSALVLATLRLPRVEKRETQNPLSQFVRDTKEGFAYTAKNKLVLAICAAGCFLNFTIVPFIALQAVFVSDSLRLGASALSVMGIALTAGLGAGSLIVPKLKLPRFWIFFSGVLGANICFALLAFIGVLPPVWVWAALGALVFFMGTGMAFSSTVIHISMMEKTAPEYLARVNGIMNSLCMAAMPAASFLCAALSGALSAAHIFLLFGSLAIAGILLTLLPGPIKNL